MLERFLGQMCWIWFSAWVLVGCTPASNGFDAGADSTIDRETAPFVYDAGFDAPLLGRTCTANAECDDAIACTDDLCGPGNRCVNVPNSGRCDNGVYCDGVERCDTRRGCTRGEPVSCDDNEVCTEDRCIEATRSCTHVPLDRDGDGDPDDHCAAPGCGDAGVSEPDAGVPTQCWRGHDCNDRDPRINSLVPELCGDGIDNNCNGFIDDAEPGGCRRAPYDRCDAPLDVSAGGVFSLYLAAARPDYTFSCLSGVAHDVVAVMHLTATHDIDIEGDATTSVVAVALETTCGSSVATETLECDAGLSTRIRRHSLPAGDYFVLVGLAGADAVDLTVNITDPTPQPPNDTCATPIVIPTTGGTYASDLIGAHDDISTTCGGTARDLVYTFTLTSPLDVTLELAGGHTELLSLSLSTNCLRDPNVIRCDSGSSISLTAHQLPAGQYWVFVESFDPIPFVLHATFGPPTPPPMGDTCANPLTLIEGTPIAISAITYQNDYRLSCATSGRDTVVQFTLPARRDVLIDVTDTRSDFFGVSIASSCPPSTASERICNAATSPRTFVLGLDPGTYYAIVKPSSDVDYQLQLTTFSPVAITPLTGNDNCTSATMIPVGRAYYTGDTTSLHDDFTSPCAGATRGNDAAFTFHLDTTERVTFVTDSSFFHVVWIGQGPGCPGAVPMSATGNTCTLGTHTTLDATLPPGDYHFILDGLSAGDQGTYSLLVLMSPP